MTARSISDVSPEALARRLITALDSKGLPTATLVGHSSSCQVVAEAARQYPERVIGLALIGPTTDLSARSWRRLAARWLATARCEDPRMGPSLAKQYANTGLGSMLRCLEAARRHNILTALAGNTRPLLVIRGRRDAIATATWVSQVADAGRGRARTLPAGGHMVVWTHGPLVAEAMRETLG
jgi:pimeloyl-ACP methyl ester carboxylesterase